MPFSFTSCMKLRRKPKKGKKKEDIQPFVDVTTRITNAEIWDQCKPSTSMPHTTINKEHDGANGGMDSMSLRVVETGHLHVDEKANITTNEFDSRNLSSYGFETGVPMLTDITCYVAGREKTDIKDVKTDEIFEEITQKVEDSTFDTNGKVFKSSKHDLIADEFHETSVTIISTEHLIEQNIRDSKRCEIINKITVNSDVFEIIEELEKIDQQEYYADSRSCMLNEEKKGDIPMKGTLSYENSDSHDEKGDIIQSLEDEMEDNECLYFTSKKGSSALTCSDLETSKEECEQIEVGREIKSDPVEVCLVNKKANEVDIHHTESSVSEDNITTAGEEEIKDDLDTESEINDVSPQGDNKDIDSMGRNFQGTQENDTNFKLDTKSTEYFDTIENLVAHIDVSLETTESNEINIRKNCIDSLNSNLLTVGNDLKGICSKTESNENLMNNSPNFTEECDLNVADFDTDIDSIKMGETCSNKSASPEVYASKTVGSGEFSILDSTNLDIVDILDNSKGVAGKFTQIDFGCKSDKAESTDNEFLDRTQINASNTKSVKEVALDVNRINNNGKHKKLLPDDIEMNELFQKMVLENIDSIIKNDASFQNISSESHFQAETDTNSNIDETECDLSNMTVNINSNCSDLTNTDLDKQNHNFMLQEITGSTKLVGCSDSENFNESHHNHGSDVTETDSYACQDEYSSDESDHSIVDEDTDYIENEFKIYPFENLENSAKRRNASFEYQKDDSNLIHFQEDYNINNREYTDIMNVKRQEKYQDFCENSNNILEPKYMSSMSTEFGYDGDTSKEGGEYITSNQIHEWDDKLENEFIGNPEKENEMRNDNNNSENNKYLFFNKERDQKLFKRYSLSSPSGSSDLSESGTNNDSPNMSENFLISACGDNNAVSDRMRDSLDYYKLSQRNIQGESISGNKLNLHLSQKNNLNANNERKLKIRISKKPSSKPKKAVVLTKQKDDSQYREDISDLRNKGYSRNQSPSYVRRSTSVELNSIYDCKRHLNKIPTNEEIVKLKNVSQPLNENEISLERILNRFIRKKVIALAEMKSNLRDIPIKTTSSFEFSCSEVENFRLANGKATRKNSCIRKANKEDESLNDAFVLSVLDGMNQREKCHGMPPRTLNDQIVDDNEEFFSSGSDTESSSEVSERMTPERRRILDTSRAIRSPKYPFKTNRKSTCNSVIYRTRPVIIKPSKMNLVAYVTKDDKNNYRIKRGFRIGNDDSLKCKMISSVSPEKTNHEMRHRTRFQAHPCVNNRATSPDDLRIKFDDAFRKYASKGRPNGDLISYKKSTAWLKDAGLIGKILTRKEANDAFKCEAGVKIALNKGDYRHFLKKLTRVKRLNYNDIYEKLCSAA